MEKNSVCYTGTHDNDTLIGLIKNASEWDKRNLVNGVKNSLEVLGVDGAVETDEELADAIIKLGFACPSDTFIIPYADVLRLGSDYRMNEPGVCSQKNWAVRFSDEDFTDKVKQELKEFAEKYNRISE